LLVVETNPAGEGRGRPRRGGGGRPPVYGPRPANADPMTVGRRSGIGSRGAGSLSRPRGKRKSRRGPPLGVAQSPGHDHTTGQFEPTPAPAVLQGDSEKTPTTGALAAGGRSWCRGRRAGADGGGQGAGPAGSPAATPRRSRSARVRHGVYEVWGRRVVISGRGEGPKGGQSRGRSADAAG
jgi:hypothetical protein